MQWCVGTAKDSRGAFFRRHLAADLGDGLAYREAFTTNAAQAVVEHLVNDRGLELVPEAEPNSALPATEDRKLKTDNCLSEPGRLVFVYRKTPPAPAGLYAV